MTVCLGVTTDLLNGGRPRRLILRKGRWYLEIARLVSTGDGVFRPHSHRIEGRAAILEALRRSKVSASLADGAAKLVDNGVGEDATFDAVEGAWIPSGLAPSYIKQLGRSDIRTPAEAALVAELTLLRASHEGLLARVARLERLVLGEPEPGKHAFAPNPGRRHAEVPFAATLREGLPPADSPDHDALDHDEHAPGSSLAFAPVTIVTSLLTELCGQDVPLKENALPAAEWIIAPERFQGSFLVDDTGSPVGVVLLDLPAVARLGGALLQLHQGEIDEQASAETPSPDAVAAASEICTRLCEPINDMPGNPHVRAKALAALDKPLPDWLADPVHLLVCSHPGGGTVAFVAK